MGKKETLSGHKRRGKLPKDPAKRKAELKKRHDKTMARHVSDNDNAWIRSMEGKTRADREAGEGTKPHLKRARKLKLRRQVMQKETDREDTGRTIVRAHRLRPGEKNTAKTRKEARERRAGEKSKTAAKRREKIIEASAASSRPHNSGTLLGSDIVRSRQRKADPRVRAEIVRRNQTDFWNRTPTASPNADLRLEDRPAPKPKLKSKSKRKR